MRIVLLSFSLIFVIACSNKNEQSKALFSIIDKASTQIDFNNQLSPTEELNMYVFKNYYNGGGVAVGDINNDGLQDLYFTGNEVSNKLYLNKGDFKFEDISLSAGVACENVWSTGASFVDINQDGLFDLYVCKSGPPEVKGVRHNELFINQGDNTFKEESQAYGLGFVGLGVHAVFMDYDKDGDLDCYLLNNSIRSVGGYDLIKDQRETTSENGNKLLQNQEGKFVDVSTESGIYSSEIGFGLGVTVGDINQDGWEDLYVSNDYFEKDYLYINQKDGSFKEDLERYFSEISLSSMGADFADINNDAYPDLFVTDMLPEKLERYRTSTNFMNWKKYSLQEKQGYHRQFVRNSMQLNQDGMYFQEISRYSGVAATDWSWGALIFDMDNDGYKDIFVANGIGKDLTDQDYVNFYANRDLVQKRMKEEGTSLIKTLMNAMPSEPLTNYAFINQGGANPKFEDRANDIGLAQKTFSNGSAYADLDNDGDLDLIVNNVNDFAGVYQNNADQHYIKFDLKTEENQLAYGAKIKLYADGFVQYQEIAPFRGFQSCVDSRPNFGLGEETKIDSVVINWPNQMKTSYKNLSADSIYQFIQPSYETPKVNQTVEHTTLFQAIGNDLPKHFENTSNAFDDESLLLRTRSKEGPRLAALNVNDDNLQDFYMPGAKNVPGRFLIQQSDHSFQEEIHPLFSLTSAGEEVNAHVFDANGDGKNDLYICYGGDELKANSSFYKDVLYLKIDEGWERAKTQLPKFATSVAVSADVDGDGDLDLYIAPRLQPGSYGVAVQPEIWLNDGKASFTKSEAWSESVNYHGFVTDASFVDLDDDAKKELVVVGEWGSPTIYKLSEEGFIKNKIKNLQGLWNRLSVTDVDQDGDLDILLGNLGENSFLKATDKSPISLYVKDFDENGEVEQFVTYRKDGSDYAYTLRDELVNAIPKLKKQYLKYEDYKAASIKDMFGKRIKPNFEATELRSGWLENVGGGFEFYVFPPEAQLFPIFAFNQFIQENKSQIILGGNYGECKPQLGGYLAGRGVVLQYENKEWSTRSPSDTGLQFEHEVRDLLWIDQNQKNKFIVVNNNAPIEIYRRYE